MPHHQRTPSYNPPRAPPVQAATNAIQTIQRLLNATSKRNVFLAMRNRRLLRENNELRKLVDTLRGERAQLVQAVTGGGDALTSDMFDDDVCETGATNDDACSQADSECTMLEPVTPAA